MPSTEPIETLAVERLVLQPFFARLRDQVHGQIRDALAVPAGNEYAAGRQETPEGLQLTISGVSGGDDQYASTFSAQFAPGAAEVEVRLRGHLALYRHARREVGFCTAQAEESLELHWSGTLRVSSATGPDGSPALAVTRDLRIDHITLDRDENDCARRLEGMHAGSFPPPRLAVLPRLELPLLAECGVEMVPLCAPAHTAGADRPIEIAF